ncbi:von Willebrand factor D and EGF domain-containing protein-like isoform X1 [Stylophora pistillata]|uniref:von Willebrand factor D and EGF domain-containing protein-like isoform X1 n=1 Tax=Stylophora pistillata TaxID=50429 RepID=UPI000C0571AF|nr:von Willebrand factor D and EGF domain-containing protein-like isoform X1 [Stylophora pistillata]
MGRGDYILYKNMERNFEVQTRQWRCGGFPTCNCGAVVRDHNNVIEFSCCNDLLTRDSTTPITVKIRGKKCLSPGISINKMINGRNIDYEVLFPSGAKVAIFRNSWGIDVNVYTPRAKNKAHETGLCLYDWSKNVNTYGNNLRLINGQSYFDTLPPDLEDKLVTYSEACLCNTRDCKNSFELAFPTAMKKNLSPMFLCDRDKRDVHYTDDLTEEDVQIFKQTPQLQPRYRRASQVGQLSKENATSYCAERISETEIGKLCAEVGVNVQALVNTCSADVELTGDLSFATGSVAILMNDCGNLAAINMSQSSNGSGEENSISVDEISELLCPNDCTFNGKCINGSCVCNKAYTAEDCSASIYQIPTISSLQGNGLCDRRKRPCRKVTVLGTGFLNSTNLTCHVREFKVIDSSWKPNNAEREFPGIMTDLVLTDCSLPELPVTQGYFDENNAGTSAAGLHISVSNDGEHKSHKNLTFISYDSACMSCNVSTECHFKNNSCLINGYCFAPNETNPIDWCYQCLPHVSTKAWSERQVNLPPRFSKAIDYFAVLGEILELTIDFVDPEGMPVTVSLMDGSPIKATVRDNVLIWNATNDAKTPFFLKATDACQATSYVNITVSLVVCQCENNGSCVPHPNKPRGSGFYDCQCLPGYTGEKCETNIDECLSYPCFRGRCIDGLNKYTCICDPGYVGSNCDIDYDDCSSSPCVHGKCTDYTGAYRCTCDPGYSGPNCTIDINECESSPCRHGNCVNQVNNYTCHCQDGYTGRDCADEIDECQSSPCIRGTCLDMINNYTCICPAGFTGVKCEEKINECLSSPCGNGTCIDHVNNYTCNCHVGFAGLRCDIKIADCTIDSCYPNVTCFKNSDTISCGPCPVGFSGDGKNCEDIDHCVNHACSNGGSCVDGINNYSCSCPAGYTGDHCENDIDDCVNHKCSNGGSCIDGINNYSCNCLLGFTGNYCGLDIDDCENHTCSNGGSCEDGFNSYSCNCPVGFTGNNCETDIDDCINHKCSNGGSCEDGVNSYSCNCPPGFTGENCEKGLASSSASKHATTHTLMISSKANTTTATSLTSTLKRTAAAASTTSQEKRITRVTSFNSVSDTSSTAVTDIHSSDKKSRTTTVQPTTQQPETRLASSLVSKHATTHTLIVSEASTTTASSPTSILTRTAAAASSTSQGIRITRVTSFNSVSATSSSVATDIPSSDKKSTTATVQPTTQHPETKLVIELSLQQKWNEDLENESSQAFNELSRTLEIQITEMYSQEDNFVGVEILSFRPGSVVAQFQLLFKNSLEDEKALTPLKRAIQDGKLGPLTVDPESLKIMKDVEEPTKEDKVKVLYPIIIGVSCGGIFMLAVLSIYLIRHSHRRKMVGCRRNLCGMPTEVAFPNPEKYELQETKSKEDIVRYEEIGMWNDDVGHDKSQVSQDAVGYEKLDLSYGAIYQEPGTPNVGGDYQEVCISNDAPRYQETGFLKKAW